MVFLCGAAAECIILYKTDCISFAFCSLQVAASAGVPSVCESETGSCDRALCSSMVSSRHFVLRNLSKHTHKRARACARLLHCYCCYAARHKLP